MSAVERARAAYAAGAWRDAFISFEAVADVVHLDAVDHERIAVSAYLLGEDDASAEAWEAAHRCALDADDPARAARCAFWLAFCLMLRGRMAHAGGWLARIERLIDDAGLDCAASGYLLIPDLLGALEADDPSTAEELAREADEIGARFDDADLCALASLGRGQALIAGGDSAGGTARLDDVMVSVTADEVGPITSGIVYCAVILECIKLFDVSRAGEWTEALSGWCDAQPDLVPYRGQCLVHRSQVQQAAGDWTLAIETAAAACRRLADPPHPASGLAHYQRAELHRLIGQFDVAESEYRKASSKGFQPMPGLALLELARGDGSSAAAGIDAALRETATRLERPALLSAAVTILGATGDGAGARIAADELDSIADASGSVVLRAMASQATGAVLISEGEPANALVGLRSAASAWQALPMPHESARTAVLIGRASSAMGDRASATVEFDNAREVFSRLGAEPDLQDLDALSAHDDEGSSVLSAREREVLGHVAQGRTNREIAAELVISQHTVGRHVENIFAKLDVSSRAAATAFALNHDLL